MAAYESATLGTALLPVTRSILCCDAMEDVLSDFGVFSLPAVLIYDADGNLLRRFDGKVDYDGEIFPLI